MIDFRSIPLLAGVTDEDIALLDGAAEDVHAQAHRKLFRYFMIAGDFRILVDGS